MDLNDRLSAFAVIISLLSLAGGFFAWYRGQFRYQEVLSWSLESIRTIQRLYILLDREIKANFSATSEEAFNSKLLLLAEDLSVLIEVGRVFFQNSPGKFKLEGWGKEKPPAYRGIRPMILDYLVAAFQAAEQWPASHALRRKDLRDIVLEAERQFVSVIQAEVGRPKTLSPHTRSQGMNEPINWILLELRERERLFGNSMRR